jgi:hypothetical protein
LIFFVRYPTREILAQQAAANKQTYLNISGFGDEDAGANTTKHNSDNKENGHGYDACHPESVRHFKLGSTVA